MTSADIKPLLHLVDAHLAAIFTLVERLAAEAHLDDATIEAILADKDRAALEVISDTADEVALKVKDRIVEARLAIQSWGAGQ